MSFSYDPASTQTTLLQVHSEGKSERESSCDNHMKLAAASNIDGKSNSPTPKTTAMNPPSKRSAVSLSPPRPAKKLANKTLSCNEPSYLTTINLPQDWYKTKLAHLENSSPTVPNGLKLIPYTGDIFDAPPSTLIIHACNSVGRWGAGIAMAFKKKYPKAHKIYREYCISTHDPKTSPVPTGSALLIRPVDTPGHWIGCVFTSAGYGKHKDSQAIILESTKLSIAGLLELVHGVEERRWEGRGGEEDGGPIRGIRMCKINSGKFGVEWEKTKTAVESRVVLPGWRQQIEVWSV